MAAEEPDSDVVGRAAADAAQRDAARGSSPTIMEATMTLNSIDV